MSLALSALDERVLLKGFLGEGGMGQVHRAWDQMLERAVAVKFFRGADSQEAERLLLEARLQARVDHPHVVKVHEVGTLEGRPCIVLQLVEGRSLSDLAQSLPLEAKVEVLRQAAEGLHAAHRQGLLHRDIKPANVLVEETPEGRRALVSDFGLARDQEGELTRSGLPSGTLDFMSPEQLLGRGPLDFRSDVYALGATLYSVLAGRHPYRDSPRATSAGLATPASSTGTEEPSQLLRRILEDEPPPLKGLVPGLPGELSLIVAKAMEKDPALRYASAEAFAEDLGRFQRGEAILARRAPLSERLLRWSRHNPVAARALAVAVAAILVGAGIAAWTARRAGLEALEAARLGADAAAMREEVRAEYLSPAHDLRPSRAALRLVVQALEQRPGVRRTGAGAFAVGTGRELLDDQNGARAAYEEAWRRGFRTPEAAAALGRALARQYEREVTRLGESLDQATQKARLAALDATYAEPARRMLSQGPRGGWQEPYSRGRIALMIGDFPTARARAAEALAAAPQRYEALILEGEAWLREGRAALNDQKDKEGLAALEKALGPLVRASDWGRSDPGLHELITLVHRLQMTAMQRLGRDPAPALAGAERYAALTLALDPEAWLVQVHLGVALESRALFLSNVAPPKALAPLLAGLVHLRRAAELAPAEVEPLAQLAYAQYVLGALQRMLGQSGRAALEEGLRVASRANGEAANDVSVIFQEAVLGQELGAALRDDGVDATAALRTSVAACERLLGMQGVSLKVVRSVLCMALMEAGREDWLDGRDPRPNLARAVEVAEAVRAERPFAPGVAVDLAAPIAVSADMGLLIGDDIQPVLLRGMQALDAVPQEAPDLDTVRVTRAELLGIEALRRMVAGKNPMTCVIEARAVLLRAKAFQDRSHVRMAIAQLDLLEGAWRITQGQDGAAALAAAERRLQGIARDQPPPLNALDCLAEVALWRARAARASGRPSTAQATAGLPLVRAALAREARDAGRHLLEARLLALAGRSTEARQARAAAAKANPLLCGGAQWKAALLEAGD
jgi:serine/threonine-protein kinase